MMLLNSPISKALPIARAHGRAMPPVRCTAMASSATQPAPAVMEAPAPSESSPRSSRPQGQRRGPFPNRGRFPPGQRQPRNTAEGTSQEAPVKRTRMFEVSFLEMDDEEKVATKAEYYYNKSLTSPSPRGLLMRSMGRQGAAGAMRMLLELRQMAAQQQGDLHFQPQLMNPVPGFGAPLIFFVSSRQGERLALPQDEAAGLQNVFTVSSRTDPEKLFGALNRALRSLKTGQYMRLDMVGPESLLRGMTALAAARGGMGPNGNRLFAVPQLVTALPRRFEQQDQALQQPEEQEEQQQPEAPEEIQVTQVYVGWAASVEVAMGPRGRMASRRGAEERKPREGAEGAPGADWEAVRGTVGSMVAQQEALAGAIQAGRSE